MARSSTDAYPFATLLINLWPGLHLLGVLSLWRWPALALLLLYAVPPLLARLLMMALGKPSGTFPVRSREFLVWWSLSSLQSIFARLPFLEELLRMVPSLYSNWLRLWGSRIGRLTYWSPGTAILDRSYLQIGDNVVLGVGTCLCPHTIDRERLTLDTIIIGDRAQVGGYSLLMPGCQVGPEENSHGTLKMRAYSRFVGGKLWRAKNPRGNEESWPQASNCSP